jgi:DNA replication protein DnaC
MKKRYCDACPICKGERVLDDENSSFKCDCLIHFNNAYALAHANIPVAFRELTSQDIDESFKQENFEHFQRVQLYTQQQDKALTTGFGLFIQGSNGAGKSFIATLILKHALSKGYSGHFILMSDLVNAAFEALRDIEVRKDLEKLIVQTDFLIIDEIDKGFQDQNDNIQKMLLPLFKKRCDYFKKPLIVTSNVAKVNIAQAIGDTIASMFMERLTEIIFVGNYRPQILDKLENEFFYDANNQ